MYLNPILNKEVKLGARTIKLPIMLMLYNAVLACVAIITLASFTSSFNYGYQNDYGSLVNLFSILGGLQCVLICFMVPILSGGAVAGERERQTLDIMLTTAVKPFSIIFGKLLSNLLLVFMLVFSSIPILSIAFIFGGMNWLNLLYFTLIIMAIAFLVGSVGVFCSTLVKKTTAAIVLTFLIGAAVVGGTFLILTLIYLILSNRAYDPVTNTQQTVDMGAKCLILLVNPILTFFEFIQKSMGGSGMAALLNQMFNVGQKTWVYQFADRYWLISSILIQLVIAFLFLFGASKLIDPIRKRESRKTKKQMKQIQPVKY